MPNPQQPRQRARREPFSAGGFSLLEMLFVVAILAFVAMIALPDPAAGEIYELELATVQVREALRQARDAARRQATTVEVQVPGASRVLRVHRVDDTVTPRVRVELLPDPASRQPMELDLQAGPSTRQVALTKTFRFETTGTHNSLYFGADGLPMYLGASGARHRLLEATLTLSRGAHARTVQVDPLTARISVQ